MVLKVTNFTIKFFYSFFSSIKYVNKNEIAGFPILYVISVGKPGIKNLTFMKCNFPACHESCKFAFYVTDDFCCLGK